MAKLSAQIQQPYYTRTERLKQRQSERLQTTETPYSPQQNIQITRSQLQSEIQNAQIERDRRIESLRRSIANREEQWNRKSDKYRSDPKNRERYEKAIRGYEERIDEKRTYYNEYIKRLNRGLSELESGKDYELSSIKKYADDYARYEKRQLDVKQENKRKEQEQLKKIQELQQQGYSPMIIETRSKTGKIEKVDVELYKEGEGYVNVSTYKPTQKIDKLEKSELGVVNVPLVFGVGDNKYTFNTSTQLYKDPEGMLITEFGSVGKTEKEVRDEQYKLYLEERSKLPTYEGEVAEVPEEKQGFFKRIFSKAKEKVGEVNIPLFVGAGGEIQLKAFKPIKDKGVELAKSPLYVDPVGLAFGVGGLTPLPITKDAEKLGDYTQSGKTAITEWQLGKENIENLVNEKALKDIEQEYQLRFEDQYMQKIIYGEIDFETAQKEYAEGETAKRLQDQYSKQYNLEYAQLFTEQKGVLKKTAGLISYGALDLVPTTVGGAVTTVGGIATLQKLKIPQWIITGGAGYFTYKGIKTLADPTKTFEEKSGGAISTLIGASILTYGGYKWARQPVVSKTRLKVPKTSLQTSAVGKEGVIKYNIKVQNQVKQLEKVFYGKQKLSQQVISGSKTTVTTMGRKFLNQFGLNLKPIYQGVPYQDPKGYKTALKRLQAYGYTPYQAKQTLRLRRPQIIERQLISGEVNVYPDTMTARGEFTQRVTRPVVEVNGIKTRGGRPVTEVYDVSRSIETVSRIVDKQVVNYNVLTQQITKTTTSSLAGKSTTKYVQRGIVGVGDVGNLKLKLTIQDLTRGITQVYTSPYQTQNIYEAYIQQQSLPYKRKRIKGVTQSTIIKSDAEIVNINYDDILTKLRGYKVTKIPTTTSTATKPIEQMTSKELKQMIKDIKNVYKPTKLEVTSRREMQLYDQLKASIPTPTKQTQNQLKEILKSAYVPPQDVTTASQSLTTSTVPVSATGGFSASASALFLKEQLRSSVVPSSEMGLKDLLKSELKFATAQSDILKQDQGLKQAQLPLSALKLAPAIDGITFNALTTTYTPTPTTFKPLPVFDLDLRKKMEKKSKKKKEDFWLLGSLPDFTARAIGVPSPEITLKDVEKELTAIKTGGEIRRGVKLRWQ